VGASSAFAMSCNHKSIFNTAKHSDGKYRAELHLCKIDIVRRFLIHAEKEEIIYIINIKGRAIKAL